MNREVVEAQVRAVLPLDGSFAVFLGNTEKTFVIYVDESVGTAISMFMRGVAKDRPLTHDLLGSVLLAFGAKVERVIINHVEGSVFHARMILSASNELHQKKLIELDARPSDSIAMAVQQGAPLFVARKVWDTVEDVTDTLAQIEKRGLEEAAAAEATSDEDEDEEDGNDDDLEEIDPDDLDLEALEGLNLDDDDDDDDEDDDEDEGYDDGYSGMDDDDDEGEEWKKPK
ncbi:bifunctional nuclease family protein [Prosthecobacter sp. SYSU 5D2]|uniref:bifunctional nuclease family protein n=1 Tax=Prosthecobacter sp. SYSU 5D2 TaxID=3134134 RepID=UPI0031FEAF46